MKKHFVIASTFVALLLALGVSQFVLENHAEAQAGKGGKIQVPRFEVDPTFPKPMPNHWYQGMSIGVGVDANDHVWIGGNGQGDGEVLKFTQDGKFLLKVGDKGVPIDSNSTEHFGMVAKISVDK